MGQTVPVEVRADGRTATTDWEVDGSLYAHIDSTEITFESEAEIGTAPSNRADGGVDVGVENGGTGRKATVRVSRKGTSVFEVTRTFPADVRLVFHDRIEPTGSVTATVLANGEELTEEFTLESAVQLVADIDPELFFELNHATTKTET
jgi:hypothetical protein